MKNKLKNIFNNHTKLRQESINLLPSENAISPHARKYLSSDFGQRYYFKAPFSTGSGISYSYSGTDYIEEMVYLGEEITKEIFSASYVSLYPISGHQANLAVLFAFTKPGDSIMVFDTANGGYPGLDKDKLPKYLNLDVHFIQVNPKKPEFIDYEKTYRLIEKIRPKIVIYSSAHTLFPIDVKGLSSKCHEVDAKFIYDGSHPLGLIVGGIFQKPLLEGADVLIAGTQKSFPGPQGGLIATNKYAKELEKVNHFVIIDNPHFHRIASLTAAMIEMKKYGNEYARQVVRNTKTLARELHSHGFNVKYAENNYSESHMFKIEVNNNYLRLIKKLEDINIMVDTAGRIGVAEMTRFGMKEDEMKSIAMFIVQSEGSVDMESLKKRVITFKKKFSTFHYYKF
ncbi:MAG: hypothetical protein CMF96_03720 [Candidatus Marinimicrobia bacterium]|nr:hypothetical protein [Candidatus Neomarinimicrobiota bacterium]|tara:strand:- start:153 stop:1346 length:1194 start_codon:yes stop_codon:yes gene_type:complete